MPNDENVLLQHCDTHYENFPVASFLLPPALREPVRALYRYARTADDIADEGELPAEERLRRLEDYGWRLERIALGESPVDPVFGPLARAIRQHDLPIPLLHDLLDAFRQDIVKTRYTTYDELLDYCRRSANPVGRLLLRLYRAESPQQLDWSDAICTSLQLINHWQDVFIDIHKSPGRIYLPQKELQKYGVTKTQIFDGIADGHWRELMRFQVGRARALMHDGSPLGRSLPGRIGLELRLIIAGGLRILDKIEAVDYDVFRRRPALRAFDWPGLLWRATTK